MLIVKGGPPQKIGKTQSVHNLPSDSHLIKLNPILTLKTEGCFDNTLNQIYGSIKDNDYVIGRIFKQLLLYIDTKFSELQEKIENFDNLSDINTHLLRIQSSQVSPIMKSKNDESPNEIQRNKSSGSILHQDNFSDKDKSSPSRKFSTKNNTSPQNGMDASRLNQFEKKMRQQEDRQAKFEQEQQERFSSFQNKMERMIRSISDKQTSMQTSDIYKGIQDFQENQKSIVSYISTSQNDIIDLNKKIIQTTKEYQEQLNNIKQALEQTNQALTSSNQKIEQVQINIQQIDQDLLVILKSYKDVLNEIFRIEILEQQQKRILSLLNNY